MVIANLNYLYSNLYYEKKFEFSKNRKFKIGMKFLFFFGKGVFSKSATKVFLNKTKTVLNINKILVVSLMIIFMSF